MRALNPSLRCAVVCLHLVVLGLNGFGQGTSSPTAPAQSSARNPRRSSSTSVNSDTKATIKPSVGAPALAVDKAVSLALANPEDIQGDYIPCKFTLGQLRALVAPDIAPTLSGADAESLKQRVIAAATGSQPKNVQNTTANSSGIDKAPTPDRQTSNTLGGFILAISREPLRGLTPGEALARIIKILSESIHVSEAASATSLKAAQFNAEGGTSDPLIDKAINNALKLVGASNVTDLGPNELLLQEIKKIQASSIEKASTSKAIAVIENVAASENLGRTNLAFASSIVDAARKGVALFERPPDIGCSMSILDWKETSQAFGHLIANQFIAVEVVVRNLNRDQQFALHDVEFEVNADPTGRLGRFFSGRDKVIVRALSSAQSSFDPRNLGVHSAQGLGMIMTAAAPIFLPGEGLVNAAGVFNSAFVIGLDRYWKDLSTDQLNLLNDVGFSSTKNSQSIVPQSGTVMVVTFIPVKPLEEGWWTQPCAEIHYLGSTDHEKNLFGLTHGDEAESKSSSPSNTESTQGGAVGIDAARALETCLFTESHSRSKRLWYTLGLHRTADSGLISQRTKPQLPADQDFFRNAYRVPYKHWSPRAIAIFEQLSNTVVAGTHILEDQQTLASLTEMKCPKDTVGNLIIDSTAATLDCPITGKNLSQLAKLRLRNSAAAIDTSTAEGTVTVSGDSANGTVSFATPALLSLNQPAYDVFGVTLKGVEQKTPATANFDLKPVITGFDPAIISTDQTKYFNVLGYHLGTLASVTFTLPATTASDGPSAKPSTASGTATTNVTVTATPLASGPSDPTVKLVAFSFDPKAKLSASDKYNVSAVDTKNNAIVYRKPVTLK